MYGFQDIQEAVITALRNTPDVVATVTNSDSIYAYEDKYPNKDLYTAIDDMTPGSIMVAWGGDTSAGGFSDARPWDHSVLLIKFPKTGARADAMDKAICNGIVTGAGVRFIDYDLGLYLDPSEEIRHTREIKDFQNSVLQYYQTALRYAEQANTGA